MLAPKNLTLWCSRLFVSGSRHNGDRCMVQGMQRMHQQSALCSARTRHLPAKTLGSHLDLVVRDKVTITT